MLFLFVFREMMSFDMASASSVQVVMVIEPLIQYSSSLFPEGNAGHSPFLLSAQFILVFHFFVAKKYIYLHWYTLEMILSGLNSSKLKILAVLLPLNAEC